MPWVHYIDIEKNSLQAAFCSLVKMSPSHLALVIDKVHPNKTTVSVITRTEVIHATLHVMLVQ